MLGFVQTWFAPSAHPIGIDLGTDYLRMAQVEPAGGETASPSDFRLIAAASSEIPVTARTDPAERVAFFAQSVREMMARGNFRGRRAILAMPASEMQVVQLTLPAMTDQQTQSMLPRQLSIQGMLPFDSANAVLRHLIAGQVRHADGALNDRAIVFAVERTLIEQYIAAAAKARLDVVGLNLEPKAIVDCFSHVYRRKSDRDVTSGYVDIGCSATRVCLARGERIVFARILDVGGDAFSRATAEALKIPLAEARLLRIKHCPGNASEIHHTPADLHHVPSEHAQATNPREREMIEQACAAPLRRLVELLRACQADYESAMPNCPVNRLIFVGGEARQRGLCRQIARELNLPAQLGDPLVRMGRISDVGAESGIDRRQPQPAWAVAIGLSMGPARVEQAASADQPTEAVVGNRR
ncbi:MAG TPA: pilus assembly protein PilM [Tepidisphaeraceae bacterium]|jgi:Tfp pilus assembly PilM family ATPase|nr:pilus assembly protein PilM [Tepidisphaeraceae bacterium]